MDIKNLGGITIDQLNFELENGAKFIVFQYCFSILIASYKQGSNIYFIKSGESAIKHSWPFILISLIFGWWGFPWGPIWTISSIYINLAGGKDVTAEVLEAFKAE